MVRIRVIHASKLLAAAAAVILAAALIVLLFTSGCFAEPAQGAIGRSVSESAENGGIEAALDEPEDPRGEQRLSPFSWFSSLLSPPAMEFDLPEGAGRPLHLKEDEPQEDKRTAGRVLIYHTHTHEAYEQVEGDLYEETEVWRTEDQAHSVVRVGDALALLLEARGFEVVHDVTDHEYPKLNTAYARSLETLEGYAGQAFCLCIDLHRDAYDSSMAECAYVNGQRAAQLMMLVGDGGAFEEKPDYEANLSFAARLTDRLNDLCPGLCRPVMVKNARYNQHVFTPSLLIEVGHNLNTLEEALAAMPVLAEAIADMMAA